MAKRFTDTDKYKKPFIRRLPGAYKLLWDYLYHDCDNAGIWIVDFEVAQIYIGADMPINKTDALNYFNTDEQRIIEFDNGSKWFIYPFIEFQYGTLSENNRAHNSVILKLSKHNLLERIKGLASPLQGAMDKYKDMDMDMDKDIDILKNDFSKKIDFARVYNTNWMMSVWSILDGKLTPEQLEIKWREFIAEMTARDDLYRTPEDYRRHFPSWVKFNLEKKSVNGEKKTGIQKPNYELLKQI